MTIIGLLLDEAIERWAKVAGIDLDATQFNMREYDRMKFTSDLSVARELDPTGLTTFMMLRGYFEWFLKNTDFSAYDLILNPSTVRDKVEPLNFLRTLLETPEIVELVDEFEATTRKGTSHYAGDRDDLEAWLKSKYDLALIRRDALRSMETLETHQFTQGQTSEGNTAQYNMDVWEFWNINSLLATARVQQIPGISLCMMRDPGEALHSYFGFICSNGETITFLTDRGRSPHPAYKRMSRRPDRELQRRSELHRFPYHLLDVSMSDDTRRLYANRREGLVPLNTQGVALSKIGDLPPDQLIWTMYMFDLIRDRFYVERRALPELSYTGAMVREPEALVSGTSALARIEAYPFLKLPSIVASDVTTESTADQWDRDPQLFLTWMLDRYGQGVPDSFVDVVGEHEKLALALPNVHKDMWGLSRLPRLESLEATDFGSQGDIERNRMWAARSNQMTYVQQLAEVDYEETKEDVLKWFRAKVKENADSLLDAAARGEIFMLCKVYWVGDSWTNNHPYKPKNTLEQEEGITFHKALGHFYATVMIASEGPAFYSWFRGKRKYVPDPVNCFENPNVRGTIHTYISLQTPMDVAQVCGVEVVDLPWQLQHYWDSHWEPYTGNSIITRIDPIDWKLHNPWARLALSVGITSSKRAYNARRARLGLPKERWWSLGGDERRGAKDA